MTPEIATLQAQIATIQANVEWLKTLMWYMIGVNTLGFVMNGLSVFRNNSKRK